MQESSFLDNNTNMMENIKKIPVLEPFEEPELHKLLQMSKIRKYRAGERIVQEGSFDTWLYFLMYGNVKIVKKGKEVAVLNKKGEIFGEMGAIECAPIVAECSDVLVETFDAGNIVPPKPDPQPLRHHEPVAQLAFGVIDDVRR